MSPWDSSCSPLPSVKPHIRSPHIFCVLCFVWSKAAPIRNIIFATICVSTLWCFTLLYLRHPRNKEWIIITSLHSGEAVNPSSAIAEHRHATCASHFTINLTTKIPEKSTFKQNNAQMTQNFVSFADSFIFPVYVHSLSSPSMWKSDNYLNIYRHLDIW